MSRVLHYTGTSDNINLLSWNATLADAHGNEVATVRTKRFHTAGSITLSATDTRLVIFRQDHTSSSSSSSSASPAPPATAPSPSSAPSSPHALSSGSHGFNLPGSPRRRRRHHQQHQNSTALQGAASSSFVHRPTTTAAQQHSQRHSTDRSHHHNQHSHSHSHSNSAKWLVVQSTETVAAVRLGSSLAVSLASGERYVLTPSGGDPRRGFTVLRMPGRQPSSGGSASGGRPVAVGQVTPGGKPSLFKTTFRIALKSSTAHAVPDMLPALLLFVVHAALDARAGERVAVATAPQIALTAAVGASVC